VNKKKDDKYSTYRQIGILTTIPMLMAVGPILGYYIGNFLDEKLGTAPYLMVIFIFFGFVAAGKGVYNLIKRASQTK
jgi:ATP synthase protein I